MNLLAGTLYDPGTAATASCTSLLAMTALDTTNLRLAFVVPPSGIVRVVMRCAMHGATTHASIVLGVLESTTVRGRIAPMGNLGFTAAIPVTGLLPLYADYLVTGLTPGASLTWDAAYGVETVAGATGAIKWGGPNNTTGNDNFGGFAFEIWDPAPNYTPTSGTPPSTVLNDRIPAALVGGRMSADVGSISSDATAADNAEAFFDGTGYAGTNNVIPTVTNLTNAPTNGDLTATMKTSVTTAATAATPTAAAVTGAVGSVTGNVGGNVAGSVGSVTGAVGSVTGLTASDVGTIKAKTDSLTFTVAGQVDANIQRINDVAIVGDGSGTPFNV